MWDTPPLEGFQNKSENSERWEDHPRLLTHSFQMMTCASPGTLTIHTSIPPLHTHMHMYTYYAPYTPCTAESEGVMGGRV